LVADDAIDNAGELTLAVTFQTQSVTEESVELTDTVRAREVQFSSDGPCETQQPGILRCTGTLNALDYRGDDGVIGVADRFAPRAVALGVTAWIPDEPGPHQSVIFGHGLGGDREQAQFLADQVVSPQSGTKSAVIAPDAPFHGTHPDCAGRSCPDLLTFFGFDISSLPLRFEGHRFRDNLRQANLDKQHIVNAILGGLDVDDDGVDDFASDGIHYVGGSLGGIMGGEFVAMTPELDTVSLIVPGARLIDVIREIDAAPVLFGLPSAGELARLYPILQSSFDQGDPGAFAGHILFDRVRGTDAERPHLLMQVALGDAIVPNRTSVFFARTLRLPVVGDEIVPVPGSERITQFPVRLNLENSTTTGFYGFDVICADDNCEST
ncbi:MAG: hypothetical protein AAFY60_19820, partial [Myxococcota bacterium]